MSRELSKAVMDLYNSISTTKYDSLADIEKKFANRKVYEPLVHTSKLYGKLPVNNHILENDYPEEDIDSIIRNLL
ncbi:MAG: hypothetical protein FWH53_11595 [Leptospirales bacterium]|nr:hypothetical protein [Leptospirales bacterium]